MRIIFCLINNLASVKVIHAFRNCLLLPMKYINDLMALIYLETRGIFLDISKAFDKVWHEGLLFKLKCYGGVVFIVSWKIICIIENKELSYVVSHPIGLMLMLVFLGVLSLAFCSFLYILTICPTTLFL